MRKLDGAKKFLKDVETEVIRANELHPPFKSFHEAYAVLLEEVDEFWDQVKLKASKRDPANMRTELIQIAAMAAKAADLLETP